MSRASAARLLLILGIAAIVRVWGLGRELWFDERVTAAVITGAARSDRVGDGGPFTAAEFWKGATPSTVLEASIRADAGNGMLYSLLLHGWSRLAGASAAALRAPSVLFGLCTVALLYAIARRLTSETGALLATALAALHPFLVRYSQEARSYSLATFLALLATFYFLRIASSERGEPRPWDWAAYGAAAGGAFLSHYLSVYVFVAHALWAALYLRGLDRWKLCAAAAVLAGTLALPWLLTGGREGSGLMQSLDRAYRARAERPAPGEDWALPVTPRTVGAGWVQMGLALTGNRLQSMDLRMAVLLPLLVLAAGVAAAGGRALNATHSPAGILVLGAALAAPAFATLIAFRSGHTIPFSAQYACFGAPYAVLLLAAGMERLRAPVAKKRAAVAGTLGMGILGLTWLTSLLTVTGDLPGRRPADRYAAGAAQIAKLAQAGDHVVYPSWEVARLFNLHLAPSAPWVQFVDAHGEAVRVFAPGGRVRLSLEVSER